MNDYRGTPTAHGVLYIILEITFDHPHESLVTRNYLSRQSAIVAVLHWKEVLRREGCLGVPHVDIRFT